MSSAPSVSRRWLTALVLGVAIWYLVRIPVSIALSIPPSSTVAVPAMVLAALAGALALTAGLRWVLRRAGAGLRDIGLVRRHASRDIALGIAVGGLWSIVQFAVILPLTGGMSRSDVVASEALVGESLARAVAAITIAIVAGAYVEELFFRGFLITGIGRVVGGRRGLLLACIVSVAWFAAGHRYQGLAGVIDTAAAATIWTILFVRTGRLAAPMTAHACSNVIAIGILATTGPPMT